MTTENQLTGFEIAVIGMAGKFPGAKNIHEFWESLKNGIVSISFFSDEELEEAGVENELLENSGYVKAKGFLKDIDYFDAPFFDYTPKEAEMMDPQIRIFHECAWEALEDAGYNSELYNGLIGLYAGASSAFGWQALTILSGKTNDIGFWSASQLTDKDFLSSRAAYKLNLKGPIFSLQTACSTSLVAVHLACQAILNGECDMALAGGVTITIEGKSGYIYQEGMIMSPDGHCRAFDARGEGILGGEGIGIVVLKRFEEAAADRDNIHAVIKGSAINNDGSRKVGFSAPSIEGQAEVIKMAHQVAHVEPRSISYIEAHGTGTKLGDPVEVEGLKLAFNTDKKNFCAIGSVKTNVGHLDSAAGVAALIKTIMALKNRLIPPSLHFEKPNPGIDFENSPFYVNSTLREWKKENDPLRAGVSSFGIGGTNAHVVLEEWPGSPPPDAGSGRKYHLVLLSAKSQSALDITAQNLAEYLKGHPAVNLADIAYTLQVGRGAFEYRRMLICSTREEAIEKLSSPDFAKAKISRGKEEDRPVIFMFPGLGSQYVNMGLDLYRAEPVFRQEMDRCFDILGSLVDYNVKEILYPGEIPGVQKHQDPTAGSPRRGVDQFEIAQVVLFVLEYAFTKLLMKWGVKPRAMIGYSFGEYTAACLSGVFSLEDALYLIVTRGRLIGKMPAGAMLSVPLTKEELKPLVPGTLSLAIDNGPSCIVSGQEEAVAAFEAQMKAKRCICVRLKASHALHSRMMTSISREFEEKAGRLNLAPPRIPYISNVSGGWMTTEDALNPAYWSNHLSKTVQFADGIKELLKESNPVFIEIGPGHDLSVLCRHHVNKGPEPAILNLLKHAQEKIPDDRYLLNKLGRLWLWGVEIDWQKFYAEEKRRRISLPTYPFERLSYWIEGDVRKMTAEMPGKSAVEKKQDITDWFYIPSWKYSPLPVAANDKISKESCWMIFLDESRWGTQLVKSLENEDLEIITVRAGENFTKAADQKYTVNPRKDNDFNLLLKELSQLEKVPDKIIHLWNITGCNDTIPGLEYTDKVQDLGFYSLMYLAQAIGKRNYKNRVQIAVVSDNMQRVTGTEAISPWKATVLGAVKVIPLEYYNIDCCSIDIVPSGTGDRPFENSINQLLMEFSKEFHDPVVAYRNNYRWVRSFEPVQLKKPGGKKPSRLKQGGVYLVTGGLGGIGYTIAEFLAKSARTKLVLTGRSYIPPREKWEQWLNTHPVEDNTCGKIKKVSTLEELGAEVLVCSADVSNHQQMKGVVAAAEKQFGCINGVIHSAGLPDGGVIPLRTREMTDKILAPKVNGTLILDDVLKDTSIDFFIICSSLSSITGDFGQLGYCAANAFQDAYAHYKSSLNGHFTVAVNWDTWKEVGLGVESLMQMVENNGLLMAEAEFRLKHAISLSEGIDVFSRIMEYSFPQIIISTKDIMAITQDQDMREMPMFEEESSMRAHPDKLYPRPELSMEYVIPNTEFEKKCADIMQQHFGFEKVGIHDNLFDFGVTSLEMIHINERLNRELKKDIPLVIMFEFPTIHSLQEHLAQEEIEENAADERAGLDKEKNLLYDSISMFNDEG